MEIGTGKIRKYKMGPGRIREELEQNEFPSARE
jgi:hypothetical protein